MRERGYTIGNIDCTIIAQAGCRAGRGGAAGAAGGGWRAAPCSATALLPLLRGHYHCCCRCRCCGVTITAAAAAAAVARLLPLLLPSERTAMRPPLLLHPAPQRPKMSPHKETIRDNLCSMLGAHPRCAPVCLCR